MPRQKRPRLNFYKRNPRTVTAVKQQCCVVCYSEFYPFPITPSKWESSITKLFYSALDIPPMQSGDGEEGDDDSIVSLPYCPQCHTKIAIMLNLRCQLEAIQHQYECVRNEIAFLVVETITQNCRNGPMDFIRQQIFEKWRDYHEEEKSKEDYSDNIGLDAAMFVGYRNTDDCENEDTSNVHLSNNADLITVKTENACSNEEGLLEASGSHEEFEDSVASLMEVELKDGIDYENQLLLQQQDQQQPYSANTSLAPNAIHTLPAKTNKRYSQPRVSSLTSDGLESSSSIHPKKIMKYSQARTTLGSLDRLEGYEMFESDAEAAALAAESVKAFTRVATVRGRIRGGGVAAGGCRRGFDLNGLDSGARALASETVKGFTRVTTIRGRGKQRRGFGNMPRLIRMGEHANSPVKAQTKLVEAKGSRGGTVRDGLRRNSGSVESLKMSSNSNSSLSPIKASSNNNPVRPTKVGLRCHVCKKKFPYATLLKLHFLTHDKNLSSHGETDGGTVEGTR